MKNNFLKFTLLLVFAAIFFVIPNDADAAEYDIYTYTVEGNEIAITDCKTSASGAITIPSEIDGKKVARIGYEAFYRCTSLTSITIPDSVTSIGNCAFYDCTSLTSITIPESVTSIGERAFYYCTSLASITIPESVTSVGGNAFYGCSNLKGVYISDLTAWCNVGFGNAHANPLYYAWNLYLNRNLVTELEIPDTVTSIGYYAFCDCRSITSVTIPESVTSIEGGAFYYCTSLTSITIPESVTSIGERAFYYCTSLTSITIPDSVTSIGDYALYGTAFYNDSSNWTDGVLYIGNHLIDAETSISGEYIIKPGTVCIGGYAFSGCTSLASITIPESVTIIGEDAFYGCSNLKGVYISDLTAWCNVEFGNAYSNPLYYARILYLNGNLVTELKIPDTVASIGDYAFYYCTSLSSITIPESVTSIGDYAFYNCTSLTSITIPDSVMSIGDDAFYYCSNLKGVYISDLTAWCNVGFENVYSNPLYYAGNLYLNGNLVTELKIPDTVTSIGNYAFYRCTSLTSITIPESVTIIEEGVFRGCTSLEEITLPFIGAKRGMTRTVDSVFGYIFGYSTSSGSDKTYQCYSNSGSAHYYIPSTLKKVTITDETVIPYGAFYNCSNLISITIPDTVTSIEWDAFSRCSNLKGVYISDLTAWYNVEFGNEYSNPLYCAGNLYLNGNLVTELEIPESVTSLGGYAFRYCRSLTSITIPESVTSIGYEVFYGCTSLTSITIPESVTSIDEGVFRGCTSLEEITLPFVGAKRGITGTVDSVFGYIFGYTTSSGSGTTRQYYSNSESAYYYIPSTLKKVTITDETVIPHGAFYNCVNLTEVTIKGNPTAIMAKAFAGHENLWNITIKSKNVRYANGRMFEITDMPTIYGYEGSTTETYAKNYDLWFVALSEEEEEGYALNADGALVNGKIVLDITTNKPVTDQALHVALYNDASKLVDYIIVPLTKEYCSFNVVFRDEQNSSFAKVFLWDGLESMTPVTQAKSVTIKR